MNALNVLSTISTILFLIAIVGAAIGLKPIFSICIGVAAVFMAGWALVEYEENHVI